VKWFYRFISMGIYPSSTIGRGVEGGTFLISVAAPTVIFPLNKASGEDAPGNH
jgi:hypothetical protein